MLPRTASSLVLTLLCTAMAWAAQPEGIPRELARRRAGEISNVRYQLTFHLQPHADTTEATEELQFTLKKTEPVLLDYREGTLNALTVNGSTVRGTIENGHVELPANKLREGVNNIKLEFTSAVAPAGKPIIRYEDRDDNTEYIYTLFVPMDASMAFPCFDQPDLKGRFRLTITAPENWTVVSNTEPENSSRESTGRRQTVFAETHPLSTYLFAFAAGPFRKIEKQGLPSLFVRQSKLNRAQSEAPELQEITKNGVEYLSNYFNQPFPFPKYDTVLIPGLPYGGMEHAGATFLREESVLFRTAPTHTDQVNRDLLVLHELTHQWFGDLTTMRWFDDLWLKEGFAEYMAFQTLDALKPSENVWKRFYESLKPSAYAIDVTQGTTPIYQEIANLKDAKSAYGAIVYDKAPGMLKQLAYVLKPTPFRDGLRLYLKEHVYANAEWGDLVHAFERVSGRHLDTWADTWIRHRGMPQINVSWSCAGNRIQSFSLSQHDVLNEGVLWPIATQVLLHYTDAPAERMRVEFDSSHVKVAGAVGKACPEYVFANDGDYAYGRFLLDASSRGVVTKQLGTVDDIFLRTLLWGSIWEAVRVADLSPADYIGLSQNFLPGQEDESLTQSVMNRTTYALHRYVGPTTRGRFISSFEKMATDRMLQSGDQGMRIIWFRGLRGLAETVDGRNSLKALLEGKIAVPGVELRQLDRWNMITALLALNDADAVSIFEKERERDKTGDGQKYAYVADAARPEAAQKQQYFNDYLHNATRPEDWVEQSLPAFNYWNQSELTAPYLKAALEVLPQIKRERKIFFLLAWLNAFIGGQQSSTAQATVHKFLESSDIDKDVRLKILQVVDELDRTVKIREKFPESNTAEQIDPQFSRSKTTHRE